jgi:hypothetical protein
LLSLLFCCWCCCSWHDWTRHLSDVLNGDNVFLAIGPVVDCSVMIATLLSLMVLIWSVRLVLYACVCCWSMLCCLCLVLLSAGWFCWPRWALVVQALLLYSSSLVWFAVARYLLLCFVCKLLLHPFTLLPNSFASGHRDHVSLLSSFSHRHCDSEHIQHRQVAAVSSLLMMLVVGHVPLIMISYLLIGHLFWLPSRWLSLVASELLLPCA